MAAAVDLDGDDQDEVVVFQFVASEEGFAEDLHVLRALPDEDDAGKWRWKPEGAPQPLDEIYAQVPSAWAQESCALFEPVSSAGGPEVPVLYVGDIQVVDLDGDGLREVVALATTLDEDSSSNGCIRRHDIVVFHNEGHGELDASKRIRLPHVEDHSPTGFGFLEADGDAEPEIVLLTVAGAYLADVVLVDEGGTLKADLVNPTRLEDVMGGLDVATGDFDGNGLDDLAVAGADRIELYLAEEKAP